MAAPPAISKTKAKELSTPERQQWLRDDATAPFQWYAIEYYSREVAMSAITATEARKTLFGLIQQVNEDHSAVEVVSRHGNAVILSKADYDAMTETAYLLRNPANAERLLEAIERARRGEFEQHDLLDE